MTERAREQEYRRLYQAHFSRLRAVAGRILQSDPDAEEVAFEVLANFLLKYQEGLRDPAAAGSYLRWMAVTKALQRQRDQRRWRPLPEGDASDDPGLPDPAAPVPGVIEEQALFHRLLPKLSRCLARLTFKARKALQLRYEQDETTEQIGEELQCSKVYSGKLLNQSLELLRRCLEYSWPTHVAGGGAMFGPEPQPVTTDLVEALLRAHFRQAAPACPGQSLVGRWVAGVATAEEQAAAQEHVPGCPACREALTLFRRIEAEEAEALGREAGPAGPEVGPPPPVTRVPVPAPARQPARVVTGPWRWFRRSMALAAAVLLVAGAVGLFHYREQRQREQREREQAIRFMGANDRLLVQLRHGRTTRGLDPRVVTRPAAGDQLRLLHTSPRPGFLAVLSLTEAGEVRLLHPAGAGQSGAIQAGNEWPLAGGGVMVPGRGCEWIVGVFSEQPLSVEALQTRLQEAVQHRTVRSDQPECQLVLQLPEARRIDLFTFRW